MREITTHVVEGGDHSEALKILALDEPGPGGAHHLYQIGGIAPGTTLASFVQEIEFQKGGMAEAGVNGISNEALLAIVQDRLECFQAGPFACSENRAALEWVENAMACLKGRTASRILRGVEGKSEK